MADEPLKLICSGCGSSLAYSATDQALKCPYCGSTTEIPKAGELLPVQAVSIIPLTVDVTALVDAVYQHLASGDMTPDHLLEYASISKKDRFYVPAFIFSGNFEASWTASFGYDREEQYTAFVSRQENGRTVNVPVTKTKTVTDWRPVNGSDNGTFAVLAYAGKGLNSALNITSLFEGKAAKLESFDESYTSGITIEPFESSESQVYGSRGEALINGVIDKSVQSHAQGDRQKDWHWTADIRKQAAATLVPLCHAIYEFEGKQYNLWLSGSNPARIIADALPVDTGRKHSVNSGFFPFWLALIAAAVGIFRNADDWGIPVSIVLACLLFGFLRRKTIIGYSHQVRQSLLAKRKVASTASGNISDADRRTAVQGVKRPDKPWLANTAHDRVALPLASLLAIVLAIAPSFFSSASTKTSESTDASSATSAEPTQAPSTPVETQANLAPHERISTGTAAADANSAPVERAPPVTAPETPAANTAPNSPASNTLVVTTAPNQVPAPERDPLSQLQASPIGDLLRLAGQGNWVAVDKGVAGIQSHAGMQIRGNRSAARSSNELGLTALRGNDFTAARAAFEQGVQQDPSDIEVRNNLAYVLVKTRDSTAVTVLTDVLMQMPDRTSAWANLAEATASDAAMSTSALKLAVRFSANREHTLDVLRQIAATDTNPQYRAAATSALDSVGLIPAMPNDRSESAKRNDPTGPSQVAAVRASSVQPPEPQDGNQIGGAIRKMLAQGESCFVKKQYSCAITSASNVLSLRANDAEALKLKTSAQAAQDQAMGNIEIK